MSELFPTLEFCLKYAERGSNFVGYYKCGYRDGQQYFEDKHFKFIDNFDDYQKLYIQSG